MHADPSWPFIASPNHPLLSALWEILAHGTLAAFVVSPLVWRSPARRRLLALAFVGGIVLDLDHAIAAGSLSPGAMEELGRRPPTHSLLFALALSLLGLALFRSRRLAWGIFAVLASHLLFDAAGDGVRWLYPLAEPESIPWAVCPVGILALFAASWIVAHEEVAEPGRASGVLVDPHPVDEHAGGELGRRVG
jgi:membrane-bound metal-dependent hydrolase YbcI (DUF457 family)